MIGQPKNGLPEHEKLDKVKENSQAIGEFLEWLQNQSIFLCRLNRRYEEYLPIHDCIEKLLAQYFEIDLQKLEHEKREMLTRLREANRQGIW